MATPTNHLTSHCGEHSSYPAHRMMPVTVVRRMRKPYGKSRPDSSVVQAYKRAHNKRSRRYMLQQARLEAANMTQDSEMGSAL